jgi:AraC-like DNA-binding protein
MPIYLDRLDIPKEFKAEHVAAMHQIDLKIAHKFGCKSLKHWLDEASNVAFRLIEAPSIKAIQDMYNYSLDEFSHNIIEVDKKNVESFLGKIENPEKATDTKLNIINIPAFRVLMVIETSNYLNRLEASQLSIFSQKFHNSVVKSLKHFKGNVVRKDNNSYLVSFKSVTNAVSCALEIQYKFKYVMPKFDSANRILNIGLSSGLPLTGKKSIFEDAILLATRMCEIIKGELVISSEVNSLYESENRNVVIDKSLVRVLKPLEELFLEQLMDYVESCWYQPIFNVNKFSKEFGLSKSQLYRKLKKLTGKSPNNFIREFRLNKALNLLYKQQRNIAEIAYETGFNSPEYFSKCFKDKYGILPSKYIQQHKI